MRTLVLSSIGQLDIEERPTPTPAPGEVLICVIATGICGSDFHGFSGHNGRRFPGQVMGHESVGRIAALPNPNPRGFMMDEVVTFNPLLVPAEDSARYAGREQHAPSRRVIGVDPSISAAFADALVVPEQNVHRFDGPVPVEWGALVEPLAVALNAVRRAGVRTGDTALIIGGGPIGQSTVLATLRAGAKRVVVSEPMASRRRLCGLLGAETIDPSTSPVHEQLIAIAGGPADVTIDAVGVSATVVAALDATRFGGTVCLVGMGEPNLTLPAFRVSTEERQLVGAFCYSAETFREAVEWVSAGAGPFAELISEQVPLDEAADAFQRLANGADIPGKILVRFADDPRESHSVTNEEELELHAPVQSKSLID